MLNPFSKLFTLLALFILNAEVGSSFEPFSSCLICPGAYLNKSLGVNKCLELLVFFCNFNSDNNPIAPCASFVWLSLKTSTFLVS